MPHDCVLMRRSFVLLCGCLVAGLLHLLAGSVETYAGEPLKADIHDMKAAYIFNFIRFTDWPDSDTGQGINLKIVDANQVGSVLQAIADKPVAQRIALHVEACSDEPCLRQASALFVGKSSDDYRRLLAMFDRRPILTMSDIPGFARHGGMIEIKYDHKKLTFIVNIQEVRRAGLYISAQLLQLGEIIGREYE